MKLGYWPTLLIPILAIPIAIWMEIPIFPGGATLTSADYWMVIGTLLSYLGFVFSAYAAYAVRHLSRRYYAKTRLPEIRGTLTQITTAMAKLANNRAIDLRPEKFISQIPVALGEIERVEGHKIKPLLDKAKSERESLIYWLNDYNRKDAYANDATIYWDLFRTLNQIAEEITAFLREQEAK